MQQWDINYWETYAPVVNWISVRVPLAIVIIHNLPTRSIDLVLVFSKAYLEVDAYMELLFDFDPKDESSNRSYVLKLNKIFYGLKQVSKN